MLTSPCTTVPPWGLADADGVQTARPGIRRETTVVCSQAERRSTRSTAAQPLLERAGDFMGSRGWGGRRRVEEGRRNPPPRPAYMKPERLCPSYFFTFVSFFPPC